MSGGYLARGYLSGGICPGGICPRTNMHIVSLKELCMQT